MGPKVEEKTVPLYTEGEKILCFHGPLLYQARCLKVDTTGKVIKYFVHYQGWNKNWDEWVTDKRMSKFDSAGLQKQKDIERVYLKAGKKLKALRKSELQNQVYPLDVTLGVGNKKGGDKNEKSGGGEEVVLKKESSDEEENDVSSSNTASLKRALDVTESDTPSSSAKRPSPKSLVTTPSSTASNSATSVPNVPLSSKSGPACTGNSGSAAKKTISKRSRGENVTVSNTTSADIMPEEVVVKRVQIKFDLPVELRGWLADDSDLISRQNKLHTLPVKCSVDDILDEYVKHKLQRSTPQLRDQVMEFTQGIRDYFLVTLGTQLLYRVERPQYAEILQKFPDKQLTEIYGGMHLLRLFVKLADFLAFTKLDVKFIPQLVQHITDFLLFFERRSLQYIRVEDYYTSSPEYQRKSFL